MQSGECKLSCWALQEHYSDFLSFLFIYYFFLGEPARGSMDPSTKKMQDTFKKTPRLPACCHCGGQSCHFTVRISPSTQMWQYERKQCSQELCVYIYIYINISMFISHHRGYRDLQQRSSKFPQPVKNCSFYSLWSLGCSFFLDKTCFVRFHL